MGSHCLLAMITRDSVIHHPPDWVSRLDWTTVFDRRQPLEIDLGCGKGAFLLWAAAQRPQHNFLGVDRLLGRLRRVDAKAIRNGLDNLRLLRIEATYFVQYLVPAASVSVYHIYFPDPWPKRRHHPRRLFAPPFVEQLARSLVDNGEVRTATDDADYFQQICRVMNEASPFDQQATAAGEAPAVPTDFERRWTAEGRSIHRANWRKKRAG